MRFLSILFFVSMTATGVLAQKKTHNFFEKRTSVSHKYATIPTRSAAYFNIDQVKLNDFIKSCEIAHIQTLAIPLPDGTLEDFTIVPSVVMSEKLATKYPKIRTYEGRSTGSTVRFDISLHGFHAILFTPQGTVYIDPVDRSTTGAYQSYFKKDFLPYHKEAVRESRPIDYDPTLTRKIRKLAAKGVKKPSGAQLRTYRLAVTATGEYTAFHGGTVEGALAAIVTTMNRVNGIYEKEVAIRMVLIDDTDQLIFTDADTDGYSNDNPNALIDEVQAKIDEIIGDANYDIGHGVSTGGGGLAGLGVPCISNRKANGITGLSQPVGDPYDVDFVAHEIGHQFGAQHTFNGSAGGCGSNRVSATAYEPGSGTTIMGYAGICSTHDIQANSDPYFHAHSFDEMIAYSTVSEGNSCAVITATGNTSPEVQVGESGFTIPKLTPFKLTGTATDADDDDLTYCWEQFDLGPAGSPTQPTGNAPLFRSFSPIDKPYRVFPQLSDIINNTNTLGEILPSYARDLTFRLTARDNALGGGGVNHDQISFKVTDKAGPFLVTSQNSSATITALRTYAVTWDVSNTNASPVECEKVNILLSLDGGLTFTRTLLSNTTNDGQATVLIPDVITSKARIKVEAVGNIFFDISDADMEIVPSTEDGFTVFVSNEDPKVCMGDDIVLDLQISELGDFTSPVTLSVQGHPSAYSAIFSTNPVQPGSEATLTFSNTAAQAGVFEIEIKGEEGGKAHTQNINMIVLGGAPEKTILQTPENEETNVSILPTLIWQELNTADTYHLQVARDISFEDTFIDKVMKNRYKFTIEDALSGSTEYFWRVKAINQCAEGEFTNANTFTTHDIVCGTVQYSGSPVTIPDDRISTVTSTIGVSAAGTIFDVNVKHIKGGHTYVEDLTAVLKSPSGTSVTLFSEVCGSNDDFDLAFDDEATQPVIDCPPTGMITYKPSEALSAFIGEKSSGTWTLELSDSFGDDGGQLDTWALEVCIRPETIPEAPTGLSLTKGTGADDLVTLFWEDKSDSEANFVIERSTGNNSSYEEISAVASNATTYTDVSVMSGETYFYRVYAKNTVGSSGYSNEVTIDYVTGLEDDILSEFIRIYPNPSHEIFNLKIDNTALGSMKVQVFNTLGKVIIDHMISDQGHDMIHQLDLSGHPNGVYIVKIRTDQLSSVYRIVNN